MAEIINNIDIIKVNGSIVPMASRRNATVITSAKQNWTLNGEETISITVQSTTPQEYQCGDRIVVFGREYTLNRPAKLQRTGGHVFVYDMTFEGAQYTLGRIMFDVNIDTTSNQLQDILGDSLTADLPGFLGVLLANVTRVFPGRWVFESVNNFGRGDFKTLTFGESDNCLSVLQNLCSQYNGEFEIVRTSNGTHVCRVSEKVGTTRDVVFRYGKGGGLYKLTRDNVSSSNLITRLFAYGSTENITSKYRCDRLCMPGRTKSKSYVEKTAIVEMYGVYEARKNFDVKPTFTGKITAIDASDILSFVDTSVNFDLNEKEADGKTTKYLINGQSAKIHFNTGNLAGYEFEVHAYNHTIHKFTLVNITDDRGNDFPSSVSSAFRFAVGDEYKILDITLPNAYINAAEQRLQDEAVKYYDQNSQPRVQYGCEVTKMWLEKRFGNNSVLTNVFLPGDYIKVVDEEIGVDKSIRIKSISRNVLDVYDYQLTISDIVVHDITQRVISELSDIDKVVQLNQLKDPVKARQNWLSAREVLGMVFDPDGDYYSEKIKPLSIDTMMLSVGARSQQFALSGVTIQANVDGNPNAFAVTGGTLVHYTIADEIRYWSVDGYSGTFTTNNALYIYAQVPRDGSTGGMIMFDAETHTVEDTPGVYYFLIGIISSVDADTRTRNISLMYGFTTINGRYIKTGCIQSADGGTYFDLDSGEIGGRLKFTRADGTTGNVADIENTANGASDYINSTLPGILQGIGNQIDGKIETWYQDNDPALNWEQADFSKHIGDIWYKTDTNESFRFLDSYSWGAITDQDALDAIAAAANAQDTADGKRQVFVTTPYPPYDIGDLWVQGATGDIMRCKTAKKSGQSYSANDWVKASKYTGDESLNDFINNTFNETISDIYDQLDGVIETWFMNGEPTLQNAPAKDWTTVADKESHLGDMYYNNETGIGYRFSKDGTTYKWVEISDSAISEALAAAARAQDTADGKRRVFVAQPTTPYDVGDLWASGTFLKRCITARESGGYNAADWDDATSYTGDESLNAFIDGVFEETISDLINQIDGKIECWYQSTDPALSWTTFDDKDKHKGDQWYNTVAKRLYRYMYTRQKGFVWEEITNADAISAAEAASQAQDTADGKRRVFTSTPYTPYDVGDLWTNGIDLFVCKTSRSSGAYIASDWELATNYTDDSSLEDFISNVYDPAIDNFTEQIDGKIETWFTSSDPSTAWTTAYMRYQHNGDLWFNTSTNELKRYKQTRSKTIVQGIERWLYTTPSWELIQDQKAIDAYNAASQAQDTADGKRQVFVTTPYPPYDIGDLWVGANNGADILRCATAKKSGENYSPNDWVTCNAYDNTKTVIDGGLVTSGTVQVAGSTTTILAGMTGQGTEETSIRFWAGASYENRTTAPWRVQQNGKFVASNAEITGKIQADTGSIGGFAIGNGHIGVESSISGSSDGLSIYGQFLKYGSAYRNVLIGTNVLPSSSGTAAVARFENTENNPYMTNYAMFVTASGASRNVAIVAQGDICCDGNIYNRGFASVNPSANTCLIPGDATAGGFQVILAKFTYTNSGIGLPSRQSVASKLGISNSTPFAFKITIIGAYGSSQTGYIIGRNTTISGMNTNSYPYRLNNNGGLETGKLSIGQGDVDEFLLVWDGSTNYVAYWLNHRN